MNPNTLRSIVKSVHKSIFDLFPHAILSGPLVYHAVAHDWDLRMFDENDKYCTTNAYVPDIPVNTKYDIQPKITDLRTNLIDRLNVLFDHEHQYRLDHVGMIRYGIYHNTCHFNPTIFRLEQEVRFNIRLFDLDANNNVPPISFNLRFSPLQHLTPEWFDLTVDGLLMTKLGIYGHKSISFPDALYHALEKQVVIFDHPAPDVPFRAPDQAQIHNVNFDIHALHGYQKRSAGQLRRLCLDYNWDFENMDQVYRLLLDLNFELQPLQDHPAVPDDIHREPMVPAVEQPAPINFNTPLLPDFDPTVVPVVQLLPEIPRITDEAVAQQLRRTAVHLRDRDIAAHITNMKAGFQALVDQEPVNVIEENVDPYNVPGWGNRGWN